MNLPTEPRRTSKHLTLIEAMGDRELRLAAAAGDRPAPRLFLVTHPWESAMDRPNPQDLHHYENVARLAVRAGAFLVVMTLVGAIYVHAREEAPAPATLPPPAASTYFPSQYPSPPATEPAEPVPTF